MSFPLQAADDLPEAVNLIKADGTIHSEYYSNMRKLVLEEDNITVHSKENTFTLPYSSLLRVEFGEYLPTGPTVDTETNTASNLSVYIAPERMVTVLATADIVSLDLYSVGGTHLFQQTASTLPCQAEFSAAALPAGVYILKVTTPEEIVTEKIILN